MEIDMKLCTSLKGSWEKYVYTELYKGEDKRIIILSRRGVWGLEEGLWKKIGQGTFPRCIKGETFS
jgi:hypothetical protein